VNFLREVSAGPPGDSAASEIKIYDAREENTTMADLSRQDLESLVSRVTAAVLQEVQTQSAGTSPDPGSAGTGFEVGQLGSEVGRLAALRPSAWKITYET
jgi:hypothetical protein